MPDSPRVQGAAPRAGGGEGRAGSSVYSRRAAAGCSAGPPTSSGADATPRSTQHPQTSSGKLQLVFVPKERGERTRKWTGRHRQLGPGGSGRAGLPEACCNAAPAASRPPRTPRLPPETACLCAVNPPAPGKLPAGWEMSGRPRTEDGNILYFQLPVGPLLVLNNNSN